jgi:hypothetical protein
MGRGDASRGSSRGASRLRLEAPKMLLDQLRERFGVLPDAVSRAA